MRITANATMTLSDGYTSIDGYVSSTTFTSEPVFVGRIKMLSATLSCPSTGTPVGTVKLQGCNDRELNSEVPDSSLSNWFDITDLSASVSSATVAALEDPDVCYRWVRLVYTRTSGSITATARIQVKGIA